MVKLGEPIKSPLEVANELSALGLQVFPARYRAKSPIVKWEPFQDTDSRHMVGTWFRNKGSLNFWVMTGRHSGYVVIDCDSTAGDKWWREKLGDAALDDTARVRTSKGTHYWFKLDQPLPSWSVHPKTNATHNVSFDVRADGTGVIVPPSVHATGKAYRWERTLEHALPAPAGLLDGSIRKTAPPSTGDTTGGTTGTGGQVRSMLSGLLSSPPGAEGSGRNDWLARVAGHYAKTYHNQRDLYDAHCQAANATMGLPLTEKEYIKTVDSVWKGEHERNNHRAIDASCGYLASGEFTMLCQVIVKRGDDKDFEFVEYADFNLRAKGVMTDEAGRRTYWAEVIRRKRGHGDDVERLDVILRAEVLGDDRAFRKFLAGYACTVVPPDNMWPRVGSPGVRIQRYLESQHPPVVEITPALGFHASALGEARGGYVTHDGVISDVGLHGLDEAHVRADPRLASGGTAPHLYGFAENEVVARNTLEEVITFHDETVTAVFGAWWAACLLKPQIEARTSLFPFVAIEAPSESGKTNGFFQMMTQLNGNTRGETQPTKAALRDMAAAHRNGIVWVDDLDDPAYLMELLRAATSGGSLTKMGEDRESVKNTQIVSPIVISGEALGLGTQKALIDRAILLKAPSPTTRRSRFDPDRPQWDDVLAVREQYPDGLAHIAGWFVQDALSVVDQVLGALAEGRTGGSGRATDKVAVLRAGARLLDYLVRHDGAWEGQGIYAKRVELWLATHLVDPAGIPVINNENTLTLELLPWALRQWRFPDKPSASDKSWESDTPVFIKGFDPKGEGDDRIVGLEVTVGFSPALLAEAWERNKHGRQEKRTTSEASLKDQAQILGARSRRVKISQSGGRLAYYFIIKGEVAQAVALRALGGEA